MIQLNPEDLGTLIEYRDGNWRSLMSRVRDPRSLVTSILAMDLFREEHKRAAMNDLLRNLGNLYLSLDDAEEIFQFFNRYRAKISSSKLNSPYIRQSLHEIEPRLISRVSWFSVLNRGICKVPKGDDYEYRPIYEVDSKTLLEFHQNQDDSVNEILYAPNFLDSGVWAMCVQDFVFSPSKTLRYFIQKDLLTHLEWYQEEIELFMISLVKYGINNLDNYMTHGMRKFDGEYFDFNLNTLNGLKLYISLKCFRGFFENEKRRHF